MKFYFAFIVIFVFAAVQISSAQIPKTISYQGIISESGAKVNGEKTITFKLYDTESGGTALWDNYKILNVQNGVFEVVLGEDKPLDLPFDKPYWLGIKVGAGAELTPRIPLTSAAYSLNAQSVADASITAKKVAPHVLVRSINKIKDNVLLKGGNNITISSADSTITISANVSQMNPNTLDKAYDQGGSGAGRTITADAGAVNIAGNGGLTVNGNVGVGTTNPAQKLDVKGTVQVNGFKMPSGAVNGYILQSDANGVGTWKPAPSSGIGGSGSTNYLPRFTGSTSLGNSEIYQSGSSIGIGTATPNKYAKLDVFNNSYYAGRFISSLAVNYTEVIHSEVSGTGNYNSTAIYGKSIPAAGYGYGGKFYGGYTGLYTNVAGGSYTGTTYGLYAYASGTSGTRIGVYSYAGGGKTNWAGYFNGQTRITGDVALAKDAVEAYEIEDEPGIAQGRSTGYVSLTSTSYFRDLVTVTITIPAAGYIFLNGRSMVRLSGITGRQGVLMQIDETSGGGTIGGMYSMVATDGTVNSGYYYHNCTAQRTYYKAKGTYTFRLEAKRYTSYGTNYCYYPVLTAIYLPTSYGSVQTIVSDGNIDSNTEQTDAPDPIEEGKSETVFLSDIRALEIEALKKREEAERSEAALLKAQLLQMEKKMADEKTQ